jgi:hypothetical protein
MSATTCILCQSKPLATSAELSTRVCRECADKTGVVPLPAATRPAVPCTRCQHPALIRVVPRELSAVGADYVDTVAGPMMVTYAVQSNKRLVFSGNEVETPAVKLGYGVLEAWICESCGFVEWYCQKPKDIPIGPAFNSERHVVPTPGFRG